MSVVFDDLPRSMTRGTYQALSHMFRAHLRRNGEALEALRADFAAFGCCFHRIVQGRLVRIDPAEVAYGPDGIPAHTKGGQRVVEGIPSG